MTQRVMPKLLIMILDWAQSDGSAIQFGTFFQRIVKVWSKGSKETSQRRLKTRKR